MTTVAQNETTTQQQIDMTYDVELVQANIKQTMAVAGAKSRDRWQVPVGIVRVLPNFNVRLKNAKWKARVRTIANSMKREGFKQDKPLSGYTAYDGDNMVVYLYGGHTRWEALALANAELKAAGQDQIESVPFVAAPSGTSVQDLTVDLVTGNQEAKLEPYEIGIVCKRLQGYGRDEKEIAEALSITETYVSSLLSLMAAPKYIHDLVQNDQISAGMAMSMLRKHKGNAVQVIKASMENAKAKGKGRLTGKHVIGASYAKQVHQSAPAMVDLLKDMQADPVCKSLPPELQNRLSEIMATLQAAQTLEKAITTPAPEKAQTDVNAEVAADAVAA